MTIQNANYRDDYIGTNVVNTYDYNYKIFNQNHLLVLVREISTGLETELVIGTDYTVNDVGQENGGSITLVNAAQVWLTGGFLRSTYALSILLNPVFEQQTDLRNQGAYSPEAVEDQLDKLLQIDLKQERDIALSLKLPASQSGVVTELPTPVADAALGWNTAKTAIVNLLAIGTLAVSALGEVILNLATTAAVRSLLRSDVWCGTAGGTANALTLTPGEAIAGYSAGDTFNFKSGAAANTGATTINISAVGAVAAQSNGAAMVGGEIEASKWYRATYDGATFQIQRIGFSFLPIGVNGTVLTADSAVAGGAEWRVTGFTTGDVKLTLKTVADTGWVLMNDGTIGNAASGGTTRANADTVGLFTLLWTNTADAQCAVSTGRGASAAADYAANKTIALPKALGRALATYGAGSGLTSRALALITGTETHQLTIAEMPAHAHDYVNMFTAGSNAGPGAGTLFGISATIGTGGDGAHENMQPSVFLNIMIKL
jgi:microcystin-dependent protein